jgi:hypothetical protein
MKINAVVSSKAPLWQLINSPLTYQTCAVNRSGKESKPSLDESGWLNSPARKRVSLCKSGRVKYHYCPDGDTPERFVQPSHVSIH